jgi:hypothetical protein
MIMLLYQLTQWLEERTLLQQALRSGTDDPMMLQSQIDQVEEQLYAQAERWKNSIQELSAAQVPYDIPYELPDLDRHAGL